MSGPGDLLVGNFGDGTISIFNPTTNQYLGKLDRPNGEPFHAAADGGPLRGRGDDVRLFTAGLAHKSHGLFGELSPTFAPGPSLAGMTGEHFGRYSSSMTGEHFGRYS